MKITNNKQHEIAVREINDRIKAINDYLGEGDETKLSEPYLIRIPPGYIRTADEFRAMLEIPITSQLKTNVAYHLILSDLYSLLLNRYKVWGTLREMIIKSQIVNIAMKRFIIRVSYYLFISTLIVIFSAGSLDRFFENSMLLIVIFFILEIISISIKKIFNVSVYASCFITYLILYTYASFVFFKIEFRSIAILFLLHFVFTLTEDIIAKSKH